MLSKNSIKELVKYIYVYIYTHHTHTHAYILALYYPLRRTIATHYTEGM